MPHVDEGTLHALLDGELGAAEVLEVQTHFATCAACAARLDEARHLLAETERLVIALEPPAGGAARAPRIVVGRPMIPLDPVVLIPDNPTPTEVRRSRFKIMGWAAGFLVVVGAGFLGLEMRHAFSSAPRAGSLRIRPEDFTFIHTKTADSAAAAPANPPAANANPARTQSPPPAAEKPTQSALTKPVPATPAPTQQDDKLAAAAAGKAAPSQPPRAQKSAPAPVSKAAPTPAPPAAKAPPAPAPTPPAERGEVAPEPAAAVSSGSDDSSVADSEVADSEKAPSTGAVARPPSEDRAVLAERAAKATEALDRERMRQRAAAATAELDREREQERAAEEAQRQRAAPPANAAAGPTVPTIDQQARLSSRIGLDEAARQLGGPLHAIDGMTRQLVGLVSPQLVPGADATRPVVRAVYVDRTGRTLYLDQQRVRPGQLDLPFTPQTGPNGQQSWMAGSVLLVLQGDLTPDSLRALARRVR